MKNLINEDFEREALKDQLYILEQKKLMEIEWEMWEEEQKRLPAKIQVVTDNNHHHSIKKEQNNETITNVLPF